MKRLLVGSVFTNTKPDQLTWLDLQLAYLKATTDDFDHMVVVSDGNIKEFAKRTQSLAPENCTLHASDAHLNGLNILLEQFRSKASEYENFLFLDGDAFPIKKHWLGSLLVRMSPEQGFDNDGSPIPKDPEKTYEVAVILRSENMERRLHASVLFAKKEALPNLSFSIGVVGNDILERPEEDVHIPYYQFEKRKRALPLLRTNQFNLHPLACGIYYDSFYHHCCGSGRWFNLRANGYYSRIVKPMENLSPYTSQLFKNPAYFVSRLAGWNPSLYVKEEDLRWPSRSISL